jgi:hypothetical protein
MLLKFPAYQYSKACILPSMPMARAHGHPRHVGQYRPDCAILPALCHVVPGPSLAARSVCFI